MKLLKLRVQNLNSLYGEHEVDLEGALGGAPLFLIVGPTGSGKSTLMDAISLALFGQTPRLPLAKSETDPDGDSRNILSRGAGMGAATVEVGKVEAGRQARYRATWECWRARKSPDGKPQTPRRTLERFEDGRWITLASDDREKFYRDAFAQLLEGMTVEDFKRSMLLAQGEFAAFLKANEDERASILERLTDTGRYKELGVRAKGRWQEAKSALERAGEAVGGVSLLDETEEAALRSEAEALAQTVKDQSAAHAEVSARWSWLGRKAQLEAALEVRTAGERAAQAVLDGKATVLARLSAHERCAELVPPLALLDRLTAEQAKEEGALAGLEAEAAARLQRRDERAAALGVAAQQAEEATARWEAAAPELTAARTVRAQREDARRELTSASEAAEAKRAQVGKARGEEEQWTKAQASADAAREQAQRAVGALESSRPLVEAVAGLRERVHALKLRAEEAAARLGGLKAERQRLDEDRAAAERLGLAAQEVEARLATLVQAEATAGSGLREALGTVADVPTRRAELRARLASHSEQRQALEALRQQWVERDRHAAELERLTAESAAHEATRTQAQTELDALAERISGIESARSTSAVELEDQRWLQEVAHQRERLAEGDACPLCGGLDHPGLRDGRFAEVDARIEARCQALAETLAASAAELATAQAQTVDLGKTLAVATVQRDLLRQRAEVAAQARAACEVPVETLGARFGPPVKALAAMEPLLAALEQETTQTLTAERALEQAEAASNTAREAVAAARTEHDRLQGQARTHQELARARQVRLAELERDHGLAQARDAALAEALTAQLAGLQLSTAAGFEAALVEASARVEALRRADAALSETVERSRVALSSLEAARQQVKLAEQGLADAVLAQAARTSALTPLEAEASRLLGGEDPAQVEQRLKATLASAREAVEGARTEAERTEREHTAATATLQALRERIEERSKQLAEANVALDRLLPRAGLADLTALRGALLPDEEARALSQERTTLTRALEAAQALRAAKAAEVAAHALEATPAMEGELAAIEARRDALAAEIAELHGRMGACQQRLVAQAEARAALGAKQALLAQAQQEFERWDRLHALIGVRDGDVFKRFAQTLNLAELIDRANAHLERLAPRYRLTGATTVAGEARLAFAVRDAFQADTVRPVSTLSGGETFLVSLALALGLASYRTVRMPIETLLLDEGFGTLDPATLQVAMGALEALNASGMQVGIISHVEALKERILSRVVLERVGNGRSTLRIEGP